MPADATDDAFLTCSFYDSDRDSNLTFSHMTRYPLGSLKILRWLANSIVHMIRQEDQGHPEFISERRTCHFTIQLIKVGDRCPLGLNDSFTNTRSSPSG